MKIREIILNEQKKNNSKNKKQKQKTLVHGHIVLLFFTILLFQS